MASLIPPVVPASVPSHGGVAIPTSRNDRTARSAFWAVTAFVTLWTGYVRSPGLNPDSLWFDDLWVASLAKLGSLVDALSIAAPVPPAFVAALWACRRLIADPELSLQLVPFLSALAGIPLVGLLVARVSGSYAIGAAAGVVMAINPTITNYSVFVKQYAVDQLVTAILLLFAARYFHTREVRHLRAGAIAGIIGLVSSFPSVFVSVPFVNLALLWELPALRSQPGRARVVMKTAVVFDVVAIATFLVVNAGRSNADVVGYWRRGFMPTNSLDAAWGFLASNGLEALQGALPPMLVAATPLVAVGLVWLLWKQSTRALGVLAVLVYAAAIVASALHRYPITAGAFARTAVFSYPVTALLFSMGACALTAWLPKRAVAHVVACGLLVGLMVFRPVSASYFPLNHSTFVRLMEQMAQASDGIVIWPTASFLAGYYSTWPISARVPEHLAGGLEVHIDRPGTLTLPLGASDARIAVLDAYLDTGRYERVLYITTRAVAAAEAPVFDSFRRHGYSTRTSWSSNIRTRLIVFERIN